MSGYQQLHQYKGSLYGNPSYPPGLEFDHEVPDNLVVSSPGGTSNIHHHWSKGMYSDAAARWDIFAGEGMRYPYAEFGNLYQTGQGSSQAMGNYYPAPDQMFTQNSSTPHIENFTPTAPSPPQAPSAKTVEFIAPPDSGESMPLSELKPSTTRKLVTKNAAALIAIVLFAYLALDFWGLGGEAVIYEIFHKGEAPDWRWLFFYAALFSIIVVLVSYVIQEPLIALEAV
jgi:proline-rich tail region repeat protein